MKVRPWTDEEKAAYEKRQQELGYWNDEPMRAGPCWLCGAFTPIAKWGDHVERHRRQGWKPAPAPKSAKTAAQVFAEWQQADAPDTDEI